MGRQYYQRINCAEKGKIVKYFMTCQGQAYHQIKGRKIYLLLDYDGTLVPIASKPDLAVLPPKTRAILRKLAHYPRCVLAIISGRSLENIKKMVKIPKIIYAGNHGLEVDYQGIYQKIIPPDDFPAVLKKLYVSLRQKMKDIKGILIEHKGMTLSVHYRLAAGKQRLKARHIFFAVIKPYQARQQVTVTTGKMVLEIRPPLKWGKGDFVKWLIKKGAPHRRKPVVFYFGDDRTDEEAFKALKRRGYAILIGRHKRSAADYYLKNPAEVSKVLERIEHSLEA